ncbi:MAG: preprotein translocase subunit SecY [Candidatus Latescibacteria bacterium]|nr:preprotein translocase subunit SecY [Candidatus Latescibacterota bacterium]
MLKSFQSAFRIPELRSRILFTLALLVVYRIGGHVPTPGIDSQALLDYFSSTQNTLFGIYDLFVGGAFTKATVFALGIMPYISASIILQLLGSVIPYFQKLQKEGEEGRKKINQYTRYGTVVLAMAQSFGVSIFLESLHSQQSGAAVVLHPGWGFRMMTMLSITTGTVFIMWLGEQITERGIGNGISMIIFIGIVARLPQAMWREYENFLTNQEIKYGILGELFVIAMMVGVTAVVVLLTQGQRKIPVQYAKRIVGRKVYGGQTTHIPLRVNTPGVIPIIFAQALMFLPATGASMFPNVDFMQFIAMHFSPGPLPGSLPYWIVYAMLIIFFSYFYTAIVFNPVDLADNMRKYGGFIPGIRPGKRTSDYIDRIITRITLPGSVYLAAIAIFPFFVVEAMNVDPGLSDFFGGTGLLIVVGVALDTLQQIESHLMMRHYDGFMKKGRLRGRR